MKRPLLALILTGVVAIFTGCASSGTTASPDAGVAVDPARVSPEFAGSWALEAMELTEQDWSVPAGARVTLRLDGSGALSGRSGVNRYFGFAQITGNGAFRLTQPLGSTRMAGPPELMQLEQRFLNALTSADKAGLESGRLVLSGPAGVLRFGRAQTDAE